MGLVGVGLLLGRELGRACSLMIIVAHGICSPMIFGYAYTLYSVVHRRLLAVRRGGLTHPVLSLLFCVLVAVNIGVPPFLNLWREVAGYTALLPCWFSASVVLAVVVVFGMVYNLFAYVSTTHGKETRCARYTMQPHPYINRVLFSLVLTLDLGWY